MLTCFREPRLPTDEELTAALAVVKRARDDQARRFVTALGRHLEEPRQEVLRSAEPDDREEETPEPVKHYPKVPKQRKKPVPWTDEEEGFLVKLVADRGPKWSSFEQLYGQDRLYGRDQTALKDKARNIMRKIIDQGGEEEFLRRCPMWRQVTVGSARRGVHGYEPGIVPKRKNKTAYLEMAE